VQIEVPVVIQQNIMLEDELEHTRLTMGFRGNTKSLWMQNLISGYVKSEKTGDTAVRRRLLHRQVQICKIHDVDCGNSNHRVLKYKSQ
jgi:hypothetical protein